MPWWGSRGALPRRRWSASCPAGTGTTFVGLPGKIWATSTRPFARKTFADSEAPNRFAWHDTGLATASLMIQAAALGLCAHVLGGFGRARARELFSIPEDHEPVTTVALGYLGDPGALPGDLREAEIAPRTRRAWTAWVFGDTWGSPSPLVR